MKNQISTTSHPNKQLNGKFWRVIFLLAGLYTAGGVASGIMNPATGLTDFTGHSVEGPYSLFFFQSLWLTIFVFGIGYVLVATQPERYPGIIILGALGKLLFASQVVYRHSTGFLSNLALSAALVDLVFVILFGVFIYLFYRQ